MPACVHLAGLYRNMADSQPRFTAYRLSILCVPGKWVLPPVPIPSLSPNLIRGSQRFPVGSFLGDFTVSFSTPTQECPCVLTALLLQKLGVASIAPGTHPALLGDEGQPLVPGDELHPGQTLQTVCGNW